jgi:TldD protein
MLSGAGIILFGPRVTGCATSQTTSVPLPSPAPLKNQIPIAPPALELGEFFGVNQTVASKVLARALRHGGDFADLFLEHRIKDVLQLEEGKVNVASADIMLGAGVRVVVGDQSGYAFTESLTEPDLLKAADTASLIARHQAQGAPVQYRGVKVPALYPVKLAPTEVPVAEKMDLLRRVDQAARGAAKEVRVVVVSQQNEYRRILLYCSDGRVISDFRPYTNLNCMVTVAKGKRTERNWYNEGGMYDHSFFSGKRPEAIAREAVRRAQISLDAVVPPAGEMPVVLAPGESGILLHEAIGHGLEADFNRKKISIYADRLGQKVANECCTIIDDGTIKHSRGALAVDDEGTLGQRTVLIEQGVLRGYMHDLISARQFKVPATGNGRRQSYQFPPLPRMTTTFMLQGKDTQEEIFSGIEKGIYAIAFTNGQVNIGGGDYSFFVNYGYLIEKGTITQPIKDVNLIGNGPQSLQRVDRVGADLKIPRWGSGTCGKDGQGVPVNVGLPHIRISKVTVGGRS